MAERPRSIDPLRHEVPIVDSAGRPTPQFMRQWMQARSVDEAVGVASDSLEGLEEEFLAHAFRHHAGGDLALSLDSIAGTLNGTKIYGSVGTLEPLTEIQAFDAVFASLAVNTVEPNTGLYTPVAGGGINCGNLSPGTPPLVAIPPGAGLCLNLDAELLESLPGSYYISRLNHTGTQDVSTLVPGADNGVLYVNTGVPTWGLLANDNISNTAAVAWSKIDKAGSSLADLATRSATDINAGALAKAQQHAQTAYKDVAQVFASTVTAEGVIANRTAGTSVAFRTTISGGATFEQLASGEMTFGQSGSPRDLRMRRSAASELTIDNNAGGAAKVLLTGEVEIDGALNHDGSTVGFFGVAPAARAAAYTLTNVTTDRTYDANATTLDEVADVLGTLIADLKTYGLLQ